MTVAVVGANANAVLTFAATDPDQVAGMVLLDSTAPASVTNPPNKAGSYDLVGRISALQATGRPHP